MSCACYVARHQAAAEINAALRAGDDPRDVARRYGIGKSRVYDHRRHISVADESSGAEPDAKPGDAPLAPRDAPEDAPHESRRATAQPAQGPAPETIVEPSRGTVEPRMEPSGTGAARFLTGPVLTARALPSPAPQNGGYSAAVQAIMGLKVNGAWRATHPEGIAAKFGLARSSVRAAHAEAVRHLQMGMGDYLARQATSALWVTKERDAAKGHAETAATNAARWRRQEREAQDVADKLTGKERFAALDQSARYGMLATKYDLSAEKWSAQALAHQRELDDVLCLRSPKALTQINLGGDGGEMLAAFGAELARRCADRPDVLAAIDAATLAIEGGVADVIDATGEAA